MEDRHIVTERVMCILFKKKKILQVPAISSHYHPPSHHNTLAEAVVSTGVGTDGGGGRAGWGGGARTLSLPLTLSAEGGRRYFVIRLKNCFPSRSRCCAIFRDNAKKLLLHRQGNVSSLYGSNHYFNNKNPQWLKFDSTGIKYFPRERVLYIIFYFILFSF